MYYVYILYSESIQRFYCGQTNNLQKRIFRHNSGETKSDKAGIPWVLIGYIICESRTLSVQLELKVKKRGIGRWVNENEKLLIKPE
jgi:putative endonuclease